MNSQPRGVPEKVYSDLATLTKSMSAVVEQQKDFQQKYNDVSGSNNKMLKKMEQNKTFNKGNTGAQGIQGKTGEKGGIAIFGGQK